MWAVGVVALCAVCAAVSAWVTRRWSAKHLGFIVEAYDEAVDGLESKLEAAYRADRQLADLRGHCAELADEWDALYHVPAHARFARELRTTLDNSAREAS